MTLMFKFLPAAAAALSLFAAPAFAGSPEIFTGRLSDLAVGGYDAVAYFEDGAPVKVADQYLLFNRQFYAGNEALVKAIWAAIERARKGRRYQDEAALMLGPDARSK